MLNQTLKEKISKRKSFTVELSERYDKLSLSKRQSECLFYILNGYTAKEAARMLNISPRTIESHIEQVKTQLNCRTKKQLIEKVTEYNLLNMLITDR